MHKGKGGVAPKSWVDGPHRTGRAVGVIRQELLPLGQSEVSAGLRAGERHPEPRVQGPGRESAVAAVAEEAASRAVDLQAEDGRGAHLRLGEEALIRQAP